MTVVLASVAFWAPVTINLPGDNGQLETLHFKGRFRRLKSSERKDLERRVRAFSMTPDKRQLLRKALDESLLPMTPREREEIEADLAAEPITDADVLKLVLGDWEVKTRKGESVPYSLSTLAELSEELDGFEAGFVRAYFAARRAAENPEEQEKNSAPQSAAT